MIIINYISIESKPTVMNISSAQFYAVLSENIDKKVAESITSYIDQQIDRTMINKTAHLASKEDLANTKHDIIKWFIAIFIGVALMITGLYFKL